MWKYVSRRVRDTFEKTANHFDKRRTTGIVSSDSGNISGDPKRCGFPCQWLSSRACWSFYNKDNTNGKQCNFEHLNSSWIGAITWSSALVLGWYSSQLINLKRKYRNTNSKRCSTTNNLMLSFYPYVFCVNKNSIYLNSVAQLDKVIKTFTPTVHLVTNEHTENNKEATPDTSSSSDYDLGEVLNSIENRLGLAAIENGQHKDGLNLLRSAAHRNHPPALYNLALCYEMGLGVKVDEKIAMEFYRSAAALEHPGALYNLGIYYGQGRGGLPRDTITASRLLRLAAVQGQEDAIKALNALDIDTEKSEEQLKSMNNLETWTSTNSLLNNNNISTCSLVY